MKKILLIGILYIFASYISYSSNYDPMIEEGNEWEYFHSNPYICFKMELRGDSIHNGKTYKKCHWTIASYDWFPGFEDDVPPSSIDSFSAGLLREKDGKVWMVYDRESDPHLIYDFGDKEIEVLIYDMNLNIGDTLQMVSDSDLLNPNFHGFSGYTQQYTNGKYVIHRIEEEEYGGKIRKVQYYSMALTEYMGVDPEHEEYMKVIEGIGNTQYGLLLFPFTHPSTYWAGYASYGDPHLNYMASDNGNNVKYGVSWLSAKSVLKIPINVYTENSTIIIEGDYSSYSVTDISGRSWNTLTVPAGLYIVTVDGRPHKIMVK